jgi:hypothetical protein
VSVFTRFTQARIFTGRTQAFGDFGAGLSVSLFHPFHQTEGVAQPAGRRAAIKAGFGGNNLPRYSFVRSLNRTLAV